MFLLVILMAFISVGALAQKFVVKNNLLYDLTLTPNLSFEMSLNKKQTFDLQIGLNPFNGQKEDEKFKHLLVQPEWRYWFCERFNGWFIGVHALGGRYNVAKTRLPFGLLPAIHEGRYEGWFAGAGVGLGYQWILSRNWNLEAELGVGYAYTEYDKFNCGRCGTKLQSAKADYFGVTKAALSLVYVIK